MSSLRPLSFSSPFARFSFSWVILVRFLLCVSPPSTGDGGTGMDIRTARRHLAGNGRVLPRSPPVQVFVRLEESTVAHCPSLSPVSAPFLRNARHFLPFLSLTTLPHHRHALTSLFPSRYSLSMCAPSLFVLYLGRLARANTTFRRHRSPSRRSTGCALLYARLMARRKFSKHSRGLRFFRHPYVRVYA